MRILNIQSQKMKWRIVLLSVCSDVGLNPAPDTIASTSIESSDNGWAIKWTRKRDARIFKVEQEQNDSKRFIINGMLILNLSIDVEARVIKGILDDICMELRR